MRRGAVAGISSNGVTHQYAYNTLNRLTNLTVSKVTSLARYAYDLGPAGNRTAVTELSGRKASYTYDDLYRLKQEKIENDPASINGAIGYDYDPVGNRKTRTSTVPGIANQTFTYDNNDRLNTDAYDANGNTVGSDSKTYEYDYENHLINQNGNGVVIVYDGDGNRVSKTVGGVTTQYLVDDRNHTGYAQVVEEIVNNVVTRQYTYGLDLISQNQGSGVSYYGYDGHGSVRFLTDATGAVTDTYDYDAFGNLIHATGNTPNNYLYSGEQLDPNVDFYYLRARYLNAGTGRFLIRDTFEGTLFEPGLLHRYLYTNNDPINGIDPTGQWTLTDTLIVLQIIGTVLSIWDVYRAAKTVINKARKSEEIANADILRLVATVALAFGPLAIPKGPLSVSRAAEELLIYTGKAERFLDIGKALESEYPIFYHFAQRMLQRGISAYEVGEALANGKRYYDIEEHSVLFLYKGIVVVVKEGVLVTTYPVTKTFLPIRRYLPF